MSNAKIKRKLIFRWGQFASALILWCVGIVLDMAPTICDTINLYLSTVEPCDLNMAFWSNLDLVYVNFNVAFLLFLESCFLTHDNEKVFKIIAAVLICVTVLLIFTYAIAKFHSGWTSHVSNEFMANMNMWTLLFIAIVGVLYFVFSSYTYKREVISND